jgi:hypothetical protein
MEALKRNYKCTFSDRQAMVLFDKEKPTYRGYTEHLIYLLQVIAAAGGHFDRNVLMSIVHRCETDPIHEISSKYDRSRTDYIDHATELAEFADGIWNERNIKKGTGRPNCVVNAVEPKRRPKGENAITVEGRDTSLLIAEMRRRKVSTLEKRTRNKKRKKMRKTCLR